MYVFVSQLLRACTNTNRITVAPKKYLVLGRTLSVIFFPEEYYCLWSVIWNQNLFPLENTIDLP